MKKLFLITTFLFSMQAHAAGPQTLLRFRQTPGFVYNGVVVNVTIQSDGKVLRSEQRVNDKTATVTELATFSDSSVQILTNKIAQLTDASTAVDPNPDAPRCMDAPASFVYAYLPEGKELTIESWMNCHTALSPDAKARKLVELVQGFVGIVK